MNVEMLTGTLTLLFGFGEDVKCTAHGRSYTWLWCSVCLHGCTYSGLHTAFHGML